MKLQKATIEAYRSIRNKMVLIVEPNVTVILGPNDHGKTNLLGALLHLNSDQHFAESDLNWDSHENGETLPLVIGEFFLTAAEREWLLEKENAARAGKEKEDDEDEDEDVGEVKATSQEGNGNSNDDDNDEDSGDEDTPSNSIVATPPPLTLKQIPTAITLQRKGIKGKIESENLSSFHPGVRKTFLEEFAPRLELIKPITALSDSVSAKELGDNEFMRGVFYYAGLNPDESETLFQQNDRTQMTLSKASTQLNDTLRESWSQGEDLNFRLTHNSKTDRVELQIEDPSVSSRYVRASQRSSGFTHYFSLKTILNARQNDNPANSYVLLFDEPGVFLHPSGQFDLLQVLETLSEESQILYVTHSLFMINKTFPARHRLIMKTSEGTELDSKPYIGRWQAVLSALGFTLVGSILFANHVILTEGDSDPIYLYSVLQKAASSGKMRLDINSLAIMSTGESRNTEVLLRLLHETKPQPKIALITDGDKAGKDRLRYVAALVREYDVQEKQLKDETTIEDHVPLLRDIYVPAVAGYVSRLMALEGETKPDEKEFAEKFLADFDEKFKGKVTTHVAEWAAGAALQLGKIKKPSKVGIARDYASRLLELPDEDFKMEPRTKALLDWIHENAGVPIVAPLDKKILEPSPPT